jgi:FecR protein
VSSRSARPLVVAGAAAVAGLLVAAFVVWNAGPAKAEPFATLELVSGSAEVRRGEADFQAASDGVGLRPGDTIRTPPDGRVSIRYFDGSVTRLDYGTTFTLQELASEPDGTSIIDAKQTSGSTFHRVVELSGSESRFDVDAPTATASVHGTTFFVQVQPDGGARFGVIDGDVLVSGENDAARLIPGRGVDVSSAGLIGPTFILTPEMLGSGWLYYNLCILDQVPGACDEVEPKTVEKKEKPDHPKPTPEPEPPAETTTAPVSAPDGNEGGQKKEGKDQEPPPPPPPEPPLEQPPEPPPPEPPEHPGNPPCDNPGNGTPCDGPGNPGSPPGREP